MLLNRSIICFGGEDWWYHHPHSKAHLMRKFARAGNKVIFVNSISMGLPSLGHKDLLPRIKRKLGSYSKLARETEEGITVVSPASLPFFGTAAARTVNRRAISAQINRLARRRGLSRPILWIAIPTAAEMIGAFDESAVVYQVSDKYDANTMDHATDPALIRRLHEHAIDAADLIFYSGRKLFNEATRGCDRSYLLEQGVDYDHWQRVGDVTMAVAPEVANIPRPRIGYFGAIEPWLVDQELIKRAARDRPEWHWIFIGNKSRGLEIEDLPTTHFLPPVAYADLPRFAAGFDVCVLPWETEQSFTSYGSAIKVREYLATGKPVVIAPLAEYEPMGDVLRIARSREEFLRLVDEALAEDDPQARARRQAAVARGTWDARAEYVSDLLEKVLGNTNQTDQ
ncbi:MAG: glycosyltransferase [Acidobacteria bacterium]|nr:glycosyltransferase [Acidobacteriota bacterium]